ncbi:SRPBCC domain-containing protein [Ferruginibacter lapsinanis]|uniref:SRPBCC family protein n=1 Tax=Ferruginibacter lapsinanis TaxID=563172 RepID=UPI001E404C51|nr:SRPBCC family protein [Ferruginibacter lapsinanis]UEG48892.1 SRPBCC domain-containing protein [Ferruginibacter lapsinanis]
MKTTITAQVKINIISQASIVWSALTKPALIKQYLFGTETITDWKPGSPIVFKGEWNGKAYQDKGIIIEIKDKALLKYSYWSPMSGLEDKPENYMVVTYEISGEEDNLTLTVTQENVPDEKTKVHSEENWRKVLMGLKNMVELRTVGSI